MLAIIIMTGPNWDNSFPRENWVIYKMSKIDE